MTIDIIFQIFYNLCVLYLLVGFRLSLKNITDEEKKTRQTKLVRILTGVYVVQVIARLVGMISLGANILYAVNLTYALMYIVVFTLILMLNNPFSFKSKKK